MPVKAQAMKAYTWFEQGIVLILLALLIIVVVMGTWSLASEILVRAYGRLTGAPPIRHEEIAEFFERLSVLREVFGGFMLVLIGIELMKTVVMYLDHRVLHVEVVFTVAVIAIARHAIEIDIAEEQPMMLIGMGAMVLALTIGYFYFRKAIGGTEDAPRKAS